MAKFMFIPFGSREAVKGKERRQTKAWITAKTDDEWGLRENTTSGYYKPGDKPLNDVKANDTVYIQAEGFTNDLTTIGGPLGYVSLTPNQLLIRLQAAGLEAGVQDVKIKIWACFSGFIFAEEFYAIAKDIYPNLIVDGYKGKTKLEEKKVVSPSRTKVVANKNGGGTHLEIDTDVEEDPMPAQQCRVRFPTQKKKLVDAPEEQKKFKRLKGGPKRDTEANDDGLEDLLG